jgi:hypothetical protein
MVKVIGLDRNDLHLVRGDLDTSLTDHLSYSSHFAENDVF